MLGAPFHVAAVAMAPSVALQPWEAGEGRPLTGAGAGGAAAGPRSLTWDPKWIFVGGFQHSGTALVTLALANWTNGGYYQAQNTSAPQPTLGSLSTEREDEGQHEQSVFPSDEKRQHDAKCDGWLHGPLCPKAFNVLSTTPITAAKLQEAWRKSVVPEDADVVAEKVHR